jgi:hypothetical protein
MWTQARNLPWEREKKSASVEKTVACYRQTSSADVKTNGEACAASAEQSESALIARNHTANRKLVDSNFA